MFKKLNKSENFTPSFICVLHTFGRSLQWSPHIHMLISEGGSGIFSPWRVVKHFHYESLRKSFQFTLLNYMEAHIGKSFRKVKSFIYKNCQNGFYVYAKPTLTNNQDVLNYIGRYLGRPVIATSRIDNYDGENVTFHYNRHEDNKLVTETVSAIDFIKKLIIHIPEKHFKMIQYYGIYAKHHRHEGKLHLFIPKEKDVFSSVKTHGERLFPCHFISTHSCANVLFFNFTLKALRFLKITRIWLIPLNVFSFHHKQKTQPIQLTDNQKFNNFL